MISSFIGVEYRSTMDIDTTVKGFDVTRENLWEIFTEICNIKTDDKLKFELTKIDEIRETDDYPGLRAHIISSYEGTRTTLTVDVTTGDSIVPSEINYSYRCVFDDKDIMIKAYPIETVLAEKLETIISRGIANTRPRDNYDIHILYKLKKTSIDMKVLKKALESTSKKRGSANIIPEYNTIFNEIKNDKAQQQYWNNFIRKNPYVKGISLSESIDTALEIMKQL